MKRSQLKSKKGFTKPSLEKLKAKQKRKIAELFEGKQSNLYKVYSMTVKVKTPVKKTLKRGSMVKPIPAKMRAELAADTFMKTCCLLSTDCKGKIQWHHNLIYAGKRVNEYGAILPVCKWHHEKESKFKKQLNRIMEFRMIREEKDRYPRRKWL